MPIIPQTCATATGSYILPYTYQSSPPPYCNPNLECISIQKCEKGYILEHNEKEYACESLHSAFEVIKTIFEFKKS
jgi:hypothetical protein